MTKATQAKWVIEFFEVTFVCFVVSVALPVGPLETVFKYVGDPAVEPIRLLLIHYAIFVILTLCLFAVSRALRSYSQGLTFALFSTSLVALITDFVFKANLNKAAQTVVANSFVFSFKDGLELVVWIVLLVALYRFRQSVQRRVAVLTIIFISASFVSHVVLYGRLRSEINGIDAAFTDVESIDWDRPVDSEAPNIVFIGLDGLSYDEFSRQLQDDTDLKEAFDGYDVYSSAYSEHCGTLDALVSLLTSQVLESESKPARRRAISKSSLPVRLSSQGYRSHYIGPYPLSEDDAETWATSHYLWNFGTPANALLFEKAYSLQLLQLGVIRYLPNLFANNLPVQSVELIGDALKTFSLHNFKYLPRRQRLNVVKQFQVFNESISTLPSNLQFVFFFTVLTHHPYAFSPNCHAVKNLGSSSLGNRQHSLQCAFRLTRSLLNKIRQLPWYDESLVVIFSDHGLQRDRDRISLAIKPPRSPAGIRFHSGLVKLMDVGDLVIKTANRKTPAKNEGHRLPSHEQIQVIACGSSDAEGRSTIVIDKKSKDRRGQQ
jgi:hypothetical protein